jgi:predicted glycoside hydrolase/deacetylase ChbG (UPF0249 family)
MPATEQAVELANELSSLSIGLHTNFTGEGTPAPVALDDLAGCRRELAAQLERFHELLERPPTHLDAHHNINRLAHLEGLFVEAAAVLGIPMREHSAVRYFPDFYGQWDGETHLEQISTDSLLRMLDQEIGSGITELSCHPGIVDAAFSSPYHREREMELATLCHPAVRSHIERSRIDLISYHDLAAPVAGGSV